MRLEILDKEGKNILESEYNYINKMKSGKNLKNADDYDQDVIGYDTSIYKFNIPDRKWNYNNNEYMQTHLLRFEFEVKKNNIRNIFRDSYNTLLITDIDLSLKGNKHFKFVKNYV
jgi:hypothetical protein